MAIVAGIGGWERPNSCAKPQNYDIIGTGAGYKPPFNSCKGYLTKLSRVNKGVIY
jgi:hypothetical protein